MNPYTIAFRTGSNVLELGGGDAPLCDQNGNRMSFNMDILASPNVNLVHDLSETPWPLEDNSFDGVFGKYCLEHLSWHDIEKTIGEIHRVLKTGGKGIFFVPNTFEQCKKIVEEGINQGTTELLFGSQEFIPRHIGSHKTGFSPDYAKELFNKAGFSFVKIFSHPVSSTDLIIEAYKIEEVFERPYFEDGTYGYKDYRDFATHYSTARIIEKMNPESVLSVGCGRGYVARILENHGIESVGMDVSQHCYQTRAIDRFIIWDAMKTPWVLNKPDMYFEDKAFDLCFSTNFLEHIPEEHLDNVIQEMARVSKRGLHGIHMTDCPWEERDPDLDITHCFPAGTLVTMADGCKKQIENICFGDYVLGEKNGEIIVAKVTKTFVNNFSGNLINILLKNGKNLSATENHPIKTTGGWISMGNINIDDNLYTINEKDTFKVFKQKANTICGGKLQNKELQGDSKRVRMRLGLSETLCETDGSSERSWFCIQKMDKKRNSYIDKELFEKNQDEIIKNVARPKMGRNSIESKSNGFKKIAFGRISKIIASFEYFRNNESISCWIDRWGREYIVNKFRKIYMPDCKLMQHRQQNDRFCKEEDIQGNTLFTGQRKIQEAKGEIFNLHSPLGGIPYTSDIRSDNAIFNNQKETSKNGDGVLLSQIEQRKEQPIWKRRTGNTFKMARVIAKGTSRKTENIVYNLETETENYFANDILVHNCTSESKAWWEDKFKTIVPDYEITIEHPRALEYERPEEQPPISIAPPSPDNLVKLNLGSFLDCFYYGWLNIDILDLKQFAEAQAYYFQQHDVTKRLPIKDNSVDIIMSNHLIEHLTREEGNNLLKECYRGLKSGGIIRISTPDTELITKKYLAGDIMEYKYINVGVEKAKDDTEAFYNLLTSGHKTFYDEKSLRRILETNGFTNIEKHNPFTSQSEAIRTQTLTTHPSISLVLEAQKP